jgi:23S rRNA pseudouridine2605 synthase
MDYMKNKSSNNFNRFQQKSNAARKEEFRREKREWKKESGARSRSERTPSEESGSDSYRDGHKPATSNRQPATALMPLNKFIAHAGICSRRDAAEIVKFGKIKVNGVLITEPGYKVSAKDDISMDGKKLILEKKLVYILLNKPKDCITTTEDPRGRKTVLDLIRRATDERVYPVGRLDRNTSGVLLLTNDGELSQLLTHPSHEVKKVYHIVLDRPLEKKDFEQILKGVVLEDGLAGADVLAYPDNKDKTQVGIEIHSGRNRIVRRIFEHLGYVVRSLDRVMFAGLTKKNVERGRWRYLTEKEVRALKYLNQSIVKRNPQKEKK